MLEKAVQKLTDENGQNRENDGDENGLENAVLPSRGRLNFRVDGLEIVNINKAWLHEAEIVEIDELVRVLGRG